MKIDEFTRVFPLRAPNIMWFLGAGASAAAGIKTAWHMIWEFKRALYCSAQRVSVQAFPDFSDPAVRARLQQYFDDASGYPAADSDDEYAFYFERAYLSESDRRRYIDKMVSEGTPSYGHHALAALFKCDKVRMIWTTNFDAMVEDAAIPALGGSGKLVSADLGEPDRVVQAMNEGRWPVLGKMHGDFRSRRLKNTDEELRAQNERMRHALVESCKRFGLAVVGYSGRDRSVMQALEEAIDDGNGYPAGLFWFRRPDGPVLPAVDNLIRKAQTAGVDAHLIETDTFDELMSDVVALVPELPKELHERLSQRKQRVSDAPVPPPNGVYPIIRLNALPVVGTPTVCRRVVCSIGGAAEVRESVAVCGTDVITARRRSGVLAFGSDVEVRKTFHSFAITQFDLHNIEARRLRYESAEHGLLNDAIGRALARERPVLVERHGNAYTVAVDPSCTHDAVFNRLRQAVPALTGMIQGAQVCWSEAVRVRLDYRLGRLWLLLEPTTWFGEPGDATAQRTALEFVRRRAADRYNRAWNSILEGWMHVVVPEGDEAELRAFGLGDGVDAVFTIRKRLAFSKREKT